MTVHPILSLNPIPGLLCECTFYFECLCELKPSSSQTGYQVNKVQVPATGVRTWILGVHGFKGQKLHRPFRIGWGSTESLCVSFCKNSTGLPLWGVGKEENDGAVRAVFATMLCVSVCVFMWVPIKALVWVSAALHGQLYVHFLYMSECTHTHLWGVHVPHWLALGTQQSCTYLFSSDRRYCPWDTEPSMLGYLEQLAWLKGHILLASFLAKLSVTFWRWSVYICLRFDFG